MILYKNKAKLNLQIKNILSYLTNNIEFQNLRKTNLLKLLEEISSSIEKLTDFNNIPELLSVLDSLKSSLNRVRYNIDKLNELYHLLDSFKSYTSESLSIAKIDKYNNLSYNYEKEIFENDLYIEHFLNRYLSFSTQFYSQILKKAEISNANNSASEEVLEDKSSVSEAVDSQTENTQADTQNEVEEIKRKELLDNDTLLISETKGKVFLPYNIENLKNILENSNKYNDLEELINDKYILPISRFKNPMVSRFKEAFYLMKNKEKAPLIDCISLALELSTNTYLNPAIIAACENVDQLDIYLDYLADDELEKFDIFKIKYEILPIKK